MAQVNNTVPTEADAQAAVNELLGANVTCVIRFPTGNQHWVYDVTLSSGSQLVARLCQSKRRALMVSAANWSDTLRPKGVPLPEILARGLDRNFPCLLLERLPGRDLGEVLDDLSPDEMYAIAARLVTAQACVAELGPGIRYGFAESAETAIYNSWSEMLLGDGSGTSPVPDLNERVRDLIHHYSAMLDAIPPMPFLHDVTTKNVIIASDGTLSGIVDVDDLCWGDPRFVKALTLVAMVADGYSTDYVDRWMQLADEPQDALFRLYVTMHALGLYSETFGSFENGNSVGLEPDRVIRLRKLLENGLSDFK